MSYFVSKRAKQHQCGQIHSLEMDRWQLVICTLQSFSAFVSFHLNSSPFSLFRSLSVSALSIMNLLTGSLPPPAAALLTRPVNTHSRCCMCVSVQQRRLDRLQSAGLVASVLSYLCYLSLRPIQQRLSLSTSSSPPPRPRPPGRVIHSSNNCRGCSLPSNTGIQNEGQISEVYSHLLFTACLSGPLFAGALLFIAIYIYLFIY